MANHSRLAVPSLKLRRSWLAFDLAPGEATEESLERCRNRRCGIIHAADGKVVRIEGRRLAYRPTFARAWLDQRLPRPTTDECQLFWSESPSSPGFMALNYLLGGTLLSLATTRAAFDLLDQIAEKKRVQAIVAHVSHAGISDRLAERLGWQRHARRLPGRHYIKRFYNGFPGHREVSLMMDDVTQFDDSPDSAAQVFPSLTTVPHSDHFTTTQ